MTKRKLTRFLAVLAMCAPMTACELPGKVANNVRKSVCAGTAATTYHRALARRVFDEVLNQGRYELFDTHYDPSFTKHVDGRTYTLAQERQQAGGTRAIASDLVMTVENLIADGEFVAIRYRANGTNDGPFGAYPPTGKRIEAHGMTIYRFTHCRIAEEWTTYNALDLLMQLGHFPPAG